MAVQRVYFPNGVAADVSPAYDAGWSRTDQAVRAKLNLTKGSSSLTLSSGTDLNENTAGTTALCRQFVSDPLDAGIVISGTVKGQIIARESGGNDQIDQLPILIKVVSNDGSTVQATLLAKGSYAATAELGAGSAGEHNEKICDGDAISSYTTASGDRLVVELGFATSGTGGLTVSGKAWFGENGTVGDLPEDETTTGNTSYNPWLEFSSWELPTATRFYMPAHTFHTSPFQPAIDTNWDHSRTGFVPMRALLAKTGNDSTTTSYSANFGDTVTSDKLWAQFISDPLDVDQTINGAFSLVIRGNEQDANTNASIAYSLRVIKPDGTERGVLKRQMAAGTEVPVDPTLETRIYSSVAVTSVAALAGDRIVLEIGFHGESPTALSTKDCTLNYGAYSGGTDFALTSGLTTNDVPWFEINQTITFVETHIGSGSPSTTLSASGSGTALQTFEGSGSPTHTLAGSGSGSGTNTPPAAGDATGSGSPSTTLAGSGSGTGEQTFEGSGSPSHTLAGSGSGSASQTQMQITGVGDLRRTLSAFGTGTALNPDSPVARRPKGSTVVIHHERKKKRKKKKQDRPRPPATEATELPYPELLDTPGHVLAELDRSAWQKILTRATPPAAAAPREAPEASAPEPAKRRTTEDRLMDHFLAMVGSVPEPETDDDAPFLLNRFLQMGK